MALNEITLGGLIKDNISEVLDIVDTQKLSVVCDAIAKAVVDHIKSSAEVQAGASVSVTITGTSPSGPVSGTGTGNVISTTTII